MDFEGFHPAETEPVVGPDAYRGADPGAKKVPDGNMNQPIFIVSGIIAEKSRRRGKARGGKVSNRGRAQAVNSVKGFGQFPKKHYPKSITDRRIFSNPGCAKDIQKYIIPL
jgi:hypothetical protein